MKQALNVYVINANRIFDNPAKKAKKSRPEISERLVVFLCCYLLISFWKRGMQQEMRCKLWQVYR